MYDFSAKSDTFTGSVLIAHPRLSDPEFQHSVVLLSSESEETGIMGVVINRPLKHKLSDVDPRLKEDPLGNIPLYAGGPVSSQEIIVTAWNWAPLAIEVNVHFGITLEKARELAHLGKVQHLIAYLGYAGWSHDQLSNEINEQFWIKTNIHNLSTIDEPSEKLWEKMVLEACPIYRLFGKAPEDTSLN